MCSIIPQLVTWGQGIEKGTRFNYSKSLNKSESVLQNNHLFPFQHFPFFSTDVISLTSSRSGYIYWAPNDRWLALNTAFEFLNSFNLFISSILQRKNSITSWSHINNCLFICLREIMGDSWRLLYSSAFMIVKWN